MKQRSSAIRLALRMLVPSAGLLLLGNCGKSEEPQATAKLAPAVEPLPDTWTHGAFAAEPPVLAFGHGLAAVGDGKWVEPSSELVYAQQDYLLRRFTQTATSEEQQRLQDQRADLLSRSAKAPKYQQHKASYDALSNAQLIEQLIAEQSPDDADSLLSVSRILVNFERARLLEQVPDAQTSAIGMQSQALITGLSGQAYIDDCRNKGVPIPPDWNINDWNDRGPLTKEFLGNGYGASRLYSFETLNGICLALPRNYGSGFRPIGVICQSNTTNKACYWDTGLSTITKTETVPLAGPKFKGGAGLLDSPTGRCTGCHLGENAFIIHPEDPAMMKIANKAQAKGWVTPLVHESWPQNAAPGKAVQRILNPPYPEQSCAGCHNKTRGMRFPLGRGINLKEYCLMVDNLVSDGTSGTMPQFAVGNGRVTHKTHYQDLSLTCNGNTKLPSKFVGEKVFHDYFAPSPEQPIVADFNGDGRADIGTVKRGSSNDVLVSISKTTSFEAAALWHDYFGLNGEQVVAGDFNGDGKDDLVAIQVNGPAVVSLSHGSGFHNATNWGGGNFPWLEEVVAGDFNNDRKTDIARFTRGNTNDVFVYLSTGSSFSAPVKWHDFFGLNGELVNAGDFNGDAYDDIIVFTGGTNGDVWVGLSNGSNGFTTSVWHSYFSVNNEYPAVGDVNGDGFDDIVTFVRSTQTGTAEGDVYVAFSNGKNGFHSTKGVNGVGSTALTMHDWFAIGTERPFVGDVDADERADIIAFTGGTSADVWVAKANNPYF